MTTINGDIDYYGCLRGLGVWIVVGWIDYGWDGRETSAETILDFGAKSIAGEGIVCLYARPDVKKLGLGFVLLLPSKIVLGEDLTEVLLKAGEKSFRVLPSESVRQFTDSDILARTKQRLVSAYRSDARAKILQIINRPAYMGTNTLSDLVWPVFFEIDAVYLCPPATLLLQGWFADPFYQVQHMRVRCGELSFELDRSKWVRIARPDILTWLGPKHGVDDQKCGFLLLISEIFVPRDPLYIEVELASGEVAYKPISAPTSTGIVAIRNVLSSFDLRYTELKNGYENVVGPAIEAMNRIRLSRPPTVEPLAFGKGVEDPRCSIIVPLYGRVDFMEYQLGFLSRTLALNHELIYVLDDPRVRREAESLAASCAAKFGRSFQLICLDQNLGYAPANNVGLKCARGQFVCFLNSDVFPKESHWLEYMLETAETSLNAGVVGALLLFEDETVQHEGCYSKPIPELAGWSFSMHTNKGRAPRPTAATAVTVEAVTGACMVMPHSLATEIGGFDEGYVIGDFEDIDLCRRVQQSGRRCLVDQRAQLYHLERQSQGDQAQLWRTNLTFYNAWRFNRRWPVAAST